MDQRIKKSLYDKSVDGIEYNPQIVINENIKSIKDRVTFNLKKATKIDIAVSYVVWSGLSLIYEDLKKFGKDSRIIITTEGLVTDPKSLEKLNELNINVKVYHPYSINNKGFHLKSYLFEKEDITTIMIGSNNISARAFGMVHEMAVEIDSNNNGFIVDKYKKTFDDIWDDENSLDLNIDFIKGYKELYKEKKEFDKTVFLLGLDDDNIKPNYMQEKALVELEEYRNTSNKGLVIAATGTGKTFLSAFDVKNANAKKILFLVHNRLILTSAIETFKRVFKDKKKLLELTSSNKDKIDNYDVIFTTDKTAYNHLYKKVGSEYFDYIIYDEAHKIGDKTLYNDLIEYFNPKFSLGITATPERTDNPKHLFEVFEYNVPYEIRLLDAMNHELVCPFTYYGLTIDDKLLQANEQFDYTELASFLDKAITKKGHYGEKLKAILFASNIEEANKISNELNNIGYLSKVAVSDGKTNLEDIEKYILSLKSDEEKTTEIICTVNKFNEGVDIPEINTIIMLRNTTSSIIYLQQLGRGLRKTSDPHKYVTVYDIIGNSKNNYTIAEVLTGNETMDKRKLFNYANNGFQTVSPFINVEIDEKAIKNIINSISNNFTVKTKLKKKFTDELYRFEKIPTLKELYLNKNFYELELFQLLFKSFYDPFENYYNEKYNTIKNDLFLKKFFELITQFIFRAYDDKTLLDYVLLLKGEGVENKTLQKVLLPKEVEGGITTAINSDYNKESYNLIKPFYLNNNLIYLKDDVISKLGELNALELFYEHIELIEELSKRTNYKMSDFELVDKGEFLFNVGAKDAYMNVVGERIDHNKKVVYCTIKVSEKKTHYDNYIVDRDKVIYYTQKDKTKEKAEEKIKRIVDENYTFYICAQFPHLGYSNTSYFNLGNVKINKVSETKLTSDGKYNHEIEFILDSNFPQELLMYKSKDQENETNTSITQ